MSDEEQRPVFGVTPPPMKFDEHALRKIPRDLKLYQVEVVETKQMVVLATSPPEAELLAEAHFADEEGEPQVEFFANTPPLFPADKWPNLIPWGDHPKGFERLSLKDWEEILALRAKIPEGEGPVGADPKTLDLFGKERP